MIPPPSTEPLEDALAHPPHLDDAGFTARVLAALPRQSRARPLVLAAGALASVGAGCLVLAGPVLHLAEALSAGRAPALADLLPALLALAAPLLTAFIALGAEHALRADVPPPH